MKNHKISNYLFKATAYEPTSGGISISRGNAKMGAIPSLSLPPILTCSNCNECSHNCYAIRLAMRHSSILNAWKHNLQVWRHNPNRFERELTGYTMLFTHFRYFVGGDIPDMEFLRMMVKVAKRNHLCKFLVFTKQYEMVNDLLYELNGEFPSNLQVIFSVWDKPIANPYELPTAKVIFGGEQPQPNDKVCGGNCHDCLCKGIACWELKRGETIHFFEH